MAQVPNDLNIKFHYNDRLGLKAIVPKAPQSHVGSVYQNSFAVKGPRLWNMLPKDLTLADNLDSFKTNLDRLLLSFRDTPPISGDETQIPNSLLDRPGKRDNRMLPGGQLQSTMAQWIPHITFSKVFKGIPFVLTFVLKPTLKARKSLRSLKMKCWRRTLTNDLATTECVLL